MSNTATDEAVLPVHEIAGIDDYLLNYGVILGAKAAESLRPLHIPGVDPLYPELSENIIRTLLPAQSHASQAMVKMMQETGSGLLGGEMGCGKTTMGAAAVHCHALQPRSQGGHNGKYRSLVLCPDTLISKWCDEIRETVPNATVHRFGPQGCEDGAGDIEAPVRGMSRKRKKQDSPGGYSGTRLALRDTVALFSNGYTSKDGKKRWSKPKGAEWYVMGRNQAKWLTDWRGIAEERPGFGGASVDPVSAHRVMAMNSEGDHVPRSVYRCPRCGHVAVNNRGVPLSAKDLSSERNITQKKCGSLIAKTVHDPEKDESPDVMYSIPCGMRGAKPGSRLNYLGRDWEIEQCGEPLFQWTASPYRWSPARIIQKKMKRFFKYLIIDEVHEHKSDTSAQSMACSKLIGGVDHVLGLTGTIMGGYADHLFPLMMRITPRTLKDEGYTWETCEQFARTYGIVKTTITTTEKCETSTYGRSRSMRRAKSGTREIRKKIEPGVVPALFARHMMGTSIFLTLEELAENLPDLFEYVGGPAPEAPAVSREGFDEDDWDFYERASEGYHDTAVKMDPDQNAEYGRCLGILEPMCKSMLNNGSMKLLGTTLWFGLDYPDRPFGWGPGEDVLKAEKKARDALVADGRLDEAMQVSAGDSLGYWKLPGSREIANWVGVCTPRDCPEERVFPKEQALVDICKKQKEEGRQSWVYVNMTGKRDIMPRLKEILEREGLRVGILRSNTVDPIRRLEWIEKQGMKYDVMLSHPELVKVGVDLFSKKPGGHNYSTIIFYETGYNIFTLRQASRRAWRLGQKLDCRVYYLYYKGSMQERAIDIVSRKLNASQQLEGKFSEDGLAAMSDAGSMQMAIAKSLSKSIGDDVVQRNWPKIDSGKRKRKLGSNVLDSLSEAQQAEINSATAVQLLEEDMKARKIPENHGLKIVELDSESGLPQRVAFRSSKENAEQAAAQFRGCLVYDGSDDDSDDPPLTQDELKQLAAEATRGFATGSDREDNDENACGVYGDVKDDEEDLCSECGVSMTYCRCSEDVTVEPEPEDDGDGDDYCFDCGKLKDECECEFPDDLFGD